MTTELEREVHQTLVAVRTLLAKLTKRQRLDFFDGVENGFCVGCGTHYPNEEETCVCLVGLDDE